ncbi:hypothetical protein ASG96_20490 [Terrabacter sp. Soil810]|nr:hypothetical protein ASG96_20490 [Terrabacter sp. Soil810]
MPEDLAAAAREFTGRAWAIERIDRWLGHREGSSFLLVGGPGTGKSTLAARLVQISAGGPTAEDHPRLGADVLTYAHFCRALDPAALDPVRFVELLASSLADRLQAYAVALTKVGEQKIKISVRQEVQSAESGAQITAVRIDSLRVGELSAELAFERLVRRPLVMLADEGVEVAVVVLVDGVDEALTLRGTESLVTLLGGILSGRLPPGVRFILTSRRDPRTLELLGPATLDIEKDAPPDVDDVREYAQRRLCELPDPSRASAAEQIAVAAKGNFLYARYVVDEFLAERGLAQRALALPEGLDGHYRAFLRRELSRKGESWRDRYRPVLGALAVARAEGLSSAQLAGITSLKPSETDDALSDCAQYLSGPSITGGYRIYHESFRQFLLRETTYQVYPHEANLAVAEYFIDAYGEAWLDSDDDYALAFTVTHLLDAIRGIDKVSARAPRSQLMRLLADLRFVEAKTRRLGIDEVLADLRAGHEAIPEDQGIREMFSVLDLQAHDLRSWTPEPFPQLFAQQVLDRASVVEATGPLTAARARLEQLHRPYLEARWRTAEESVCLLRTIRHGGGWVLGCGGVGSAAVVATGSPGGTVQVWEVESGLLRQSFAGDGPAITSLAVTPDGGSVLAGCADGTLLAWDVVSGLGRRFAQRPSSQVVSLCLFSDGSRALSASADGTLGLWDVETRTLRRTLMGSGGVVNGVAVTSDGRRAVSISADRTVRVWDVDNGAEQAVMHAHQDLMLSVCVLPGDRHAVSGSWDGQMRCWELHADGTVTAAAEMVAKLDTSGGPVWGLVPTSATTVLAARDDGMVEHWDLANGRRLGLLSGHRSAARAVTMSADGRRAVSVAEDQTLKVWDLTVPAEPGVLRGHGIEVTSTAVSSDGSLALSNSRVYGRVKAWDVREGQQIWEHSRDTEYERVAIMEPGSRALLCAKGPHSSAFVLETHSIAARNEPNQIVLSLGSVLWSSGNWVLAAGKEYEESEPAGTAKVEMDVFMGFGAVGMQRERLVYRVLDASSAEVAHMLSVDQVSGWPSAAAITPDCRRVVAISSPTRDSTGTVLSWDTSTGEVRTTAGPESGHVFGMAVTADGSYAAAGLSDGSIDVWGLDDGSRRSVAPDVGQIMGLAPLDGWKIVSVSSEGVLIVWDMSVPRQLARTFVGHSLSSVAATRDGSTIFVGDNWGNVHAYSLRTPHSPEVS